jgi:hypothetical protein
LRRARRLVPRLTRGMVLFSCGAFRKRWQIQFK